ncbi:MAG: hypothetical protein IJ396_07590 [Oscillibacter sp.]|nr:hypothetical protein [Oscillibacter sp.]
MLELLKMLVLIAAGAAAIKLLTRTMTPNRIQKQLDKELKEAEESDET